MKAFIIFRDRVTYGHLCFTALIEAGLEPVIADHGSTWPLALDWLAVLDAAGVTVLRRGGGHPRGLWSWPPFRDMAGPDERYVVTDCDVTPAASCPPDWPARLGELLDRYPDAAKAGLGLAVHDLPDCYPRRDQVIAWEAQFAAAHSPEEGVRRAGVDTTLALYPPLSGRPAHAIDGSLRTAWPYLADHLPWHEDFANLDPEQDWYYSHTEPGIAHWAPPGRSKWDG